MAAFRFPIEPGHVLTFARAIGDHALAERLVASLGGDGLADGATVPPTFLQASAHFDPRYGLRPRPDRPWHGSAADAGQAPTGSAGLHAEQHFTYHRPVRIGETLTVNQRHGESWTKRGRSGALEFTEYVTDYRDAAGRPVATACTIAVVQRDPSVGGQS